MMRMRTKTPAGGPRLPLPTKSKTSVGGGDVAGGGGGGGGGGSGDGNWEMRPCGMLVQTRSDSDQNRRPPPPTIRVRVKYGSVYHEVTLSSQASFGELKKMLTGPTGLHHEDQKLFYKDKERDSKVFLDTTGVKNKSKIVLIKDSISQEKRYLEMKRAAKLEKATKTISDISLEVDKLAGQVAALESVISKGGKVTENYVVNLIELLMDQLVKLDTILKEVDSKVQMQGKVQVTRVQNCVETLDMLKIKNSIANGNANGSPTKLKEDNKKLSNEHIVQSPVGKQQQSDRNPFNVVPNSSQKQSIPPSRLSIVSRSSPVKPQEGKHSIGITQQPLEQLLQPAMGSPGSGTGSGSSSGRVVITTNWETFDSFPEANTSSNPSGSSTPAAHQPAFNLDLLSI
ncbi:OLC1v1015666C1 [Oldenlandia corymbosa var. corymbosa]|uniref:OLC1v1015666C1 n=1 Tax=Oldenlandia corymbosa var. corymbosa TaxID=529605 RepID=A0AAV1E623_OLDCO|nr:OLC1v1015666C1 [Oldenlandia corymbosa var. corymbosa]